MIEGQADKFIVVNRATGDAEVVELPISVPLIGSIETVQGLQDYASEVLHENALVFEFTSDVGSLIRVY